MAKYKNKLELQQKLSVLNNKISFSIKYTYHYCKNIFFTPLFNDVIIDIIKDELSLGKKEIRFYYDDKNIKFESLKELYKQFCLQYNVKGNYDEELFLTVFHLVKNEFFRYTRSNNKNNWDLIVSKSADEFGQYFYIDMIPK